MRTSRWWRAAILALTAWLLLSPPIAQAADVRTGDSIVIAPRQVLREDLYVIANSVVVDGTLDGDLFAIAGAVRINGRVTGSVFAAAVEVAITGQVDGDVRAAAASVTVAAPAGGEQRPTIGGDLLAAGASIVLDSTGSVGRDTVLGGRSVVLAGPIGRHVKGGGSDITINNTVGGEVDLQTVDRLILGSAARIAGDLHYQSRQEAERDSRAQVGGQIERTEGAADAGARIRATLFNILAVTILGAAVLLLSRRGVESAGAAIVRQPVLCLGWGFGLLVGIPLAALLLLVTVVGAPLALIVIALYALVLYTSQAIVGLAVGRLLLSQLRPVEGYRWSVLCILVGVLVLSALRSVPFLDGLVTLLMLIVGLGAIWLAYLDGRGGAIRDTQSAVA